MNRKGQLGKLIAIVPIMFWIFIIMAIFILLASAWSLTHQNDSFAIGVFSQSDLMERSIVMFEKDTTIRNALFDVADNYASDRKTWLSAFDKSLRDFLSEDSKSNEADKDMCLMIFAQIGGVAQQTKLLMPSEDDGKGFFSIYLRRNVNGVIFSGGEHLMGVYSHYPSGFRFFNWLTENNNGLNGAYYYGACLK